MEGVGLFLEKKILISCLLWYRSTSFQSDLSISEGDSAANGGIFEKCVCMRESSCNIPSERDLYDGFAIIVCFSLPVLGVRAQEPRGG